MVEREQLVINLKTMRERAEFLSANQHTMGLNKPIRRKDHWYSLYVYFDCPCCGNRPYLVLKRRQAEHCIALGLSKKPGTPLTKSQMDWQQEQLRIVHSLNSNGCGVKYSSQDKLNTSIKGHGKYSDNANKLLLGVDL